MIDRKRGPGEYDGLKAEQEAARATDVAAKPYSRYDKLNDRSGQPATTDSKPHLGETTLQSNAPSAATERSEPEPVDYSDPHRYQKAVAARPNERPRDVIWALNRDDNMAAVQARIAEERQGPSASSNKANEEELSDQEMTDAKLALPDAKQARIDRIKANGIATEAAIAARDRDRGGRE